MMSSDSGSSTLTVKPIPRPSSLGESAYEALKAAILHGDLTPGDQLKEELLAARFGISPTPVREALARLEQEGLTYKIPHRGTFVTELSVDDVHEIYDVRRTLESWAVELVATSISEEALGELLRILDSLSDHLAQAEENQLASQSLRRLASEADVRFHAVIVDEAGNQWLQRVLSLLSDHLYRIRFFSGTRVSHVRESVQDHHRILAALREGDAAKAHQLMDEHIRAAMQRVTKLIADRS